MTLLLWLLTALLFTLIGILIGYELDEPLIKSYDHLVKIQDQIIKEKKLNK